MEGLARWLAPVDVAWFIENHLGRKPFAAPGRAREALPLLQWPTFGQVLACGDAVDVLTVERGRLVEAARPRSLLEMRALMRGGVSVVVRAGERHDVGLRALAASFESLFPGEVHLQLYGTPAGTHSFGWHYDFEDVYIVQTAGVKDYYFRENTVARAARLGERLDFSSVTHERTPLFSCRLVAGDWLYIPARWWHFVTCAEDALSISVGVMPVETLRDARRLPPGWSGSASTPMQRAGPVRHDVAPP